LPSWTPDKVLDQICPAGILPHFCVRDYCAPDLKIVSPCPSAPGSKMPPHNEVRNYPAVVVVGQ
jgi:hypothetical protein